ncbi:MAG: hypothetical protein V4699_02455 [Patescibacteria group bacterium]
MIFQVIQIRKMVGEAKENPGKFAGAKMGELFMGMLITPSLVVLSVLAIFFVFGFTTFIGGPYWFFKLLFFLSLSAVICILYFLRKIYLMIKSVAKEVIDSTIKVESKVIK